MDKIQITHDTTTHKVRIIKGDKVIFSDHKVNILNDVLGKTLRDILVECGCENVELKIT